MKHRACCPPTCEALESRQLLAADLAAVSLTGKFPPAAVSGGASQIKELKMKVRNAGDVTLANSGDQKTVFRVFASADGVLDEDDTPLWDTQKKLNLKPGKSATISLKTGNLPGTLDGTYQFLALADATNVFQEFNESNNVAANAAQVSIAEPFSSLDSLKITLPGSANNGKQVTYKLQLQNIGNSQAAGDIVPTIQLIPVGGGVPTSFTVPAMKVKLDSGKTKTFSGKFALPLLSPGQYTYTIDFVPARPDLDAELDDNLVAGTKTLKIKN